MPAPDEELKVRVSVDISQLQAGIRKATGAIRNLAAATSSASGDDFSGMAAQLKQLSGTISTMNTGNLTSAIRTIETLMDALKTAEQMANDRTGNRSSISAIECRKAWSAAKEVLDQYREAQKEEEKEAEKAAKAAEKLAEAQQKNAEAMSNASGKGGKLMSVIGKMTLYRALRSVLSGISAALKEGLKNLYAWDQAHNGVAGVVKTMDAYQSSITKLKNSVGAALYPVLTSLLPVFQQICNWLITGINYVNQFFALLSGSSYYLQAADVNDQYADSIAGVGAAAAKASKDLMGFDEINRLSGKSGGGGGGGTGYAYDIGDAFKEVAIDQGFKEKVQPFIDWIKEDLMPVIQNLWEVAKPLLEFVWQMIQNFVQSDALQVANDLLKDLKMVFSGGPDAIKGVMQLLWDVLNGPLYGIGIAFDAIFGTNVTKKLREFLNGVEEINDVFALMKKATDEVCKSSERARKARDEYTKSTKTLADKEKYRLQIEKALNEIDTQQNNLYRALTIAQNNLKRAQEELTAAQKEAAEWGTADSDRLLAAQQAYKKAQEAVDQYTKALEDGAALSQIWTREYANMTDEINEMGKTVANLPAHKKVEIDVDITKTKQQIAQCFPKKVRIPITFVSNTQGINLHEVSSTISQAIYWGAKGGILNGATLIGAGEAGKEALLPLDRNTEWMDKLADRIGRNQTIRINLDGREVYNVVVARNNAQVRRTGASELLV